MTSSSVRTICILTAVSISLAISGVCLSASNISTLQEQARLYRQQGLTQQKQGDLETALSYYQKAIELDPNYVIAYNDLGVVYDLMGMTDLAEQVYMKGLKMNPRYLNFYSNLAMLYEGKKDYAQAAHYWGRRSVLGDPKDPWTENAKKRLDAITFMVPELRQRLIEQESINLIQQVQEQKKLQKEMDLKKAAEHLANAKKLFNEGKYQKVLEEVNLALSLDPQIKDTQDLMDKTKVKIKEQEKEAFIAKMEKYYQDGKRFYQQDNLQAAKQEFDKIAELAASPQK